MHFNPFFLFNPFFFMKAQQQLLNSRLSPPACANRMSRSAFPSSRKETANVLAQNRAIQPNAVWLHRSSSALSGTPKEPYTKAQRTVLATSSFLERTSQRVVWGVFFLPIKPGSLFLNRMPQGNLKRANLSP